MHPKDLTNNYIESIHLNKTAVADKTLIDNDLERRMDLAQRIVSLTRFLREKSKLRIRQPLRRILIPVSNPAERRDIQQVEDIIKEELNIKTIEFITDDTAIITKSAKGNFKTLGKKFGKQTQEVANLIKEMTNEQIRQLEREDKVTLGNFIIELEDVEIASNDIEGWLLANDAALTVALDTTLDEELIQEGIAREFVSKVQNLRKDSGFDVVDRITIVVVCNEDIKTALAAKQEYISNETLCNKLEFLDSLDNKYEIAFLDDKILIKITKVDTM